MQRNFFVLLRRHRYVAIALRSYLDLRNAGSLNAYGTIAAQDDAPTDKPGRPKSRLTAVGWDLYNICRSQSDRFNTKLWKVWNIG